MTMIKLTKIYIVFGWALIAMGILCLAKGENFGYEAIPLGAISVLIGNWSKRRQKEATDEH